MVSILGNKMKGFCKIGLVKYVVFLWIVVSSWTFYNFISIIDFEEWDEGRMFWYLFNKDIKKDYFRLDMFLVIVVNNSNNNNNKGVCVCLFV